MAAEKLTKNLKDGLDIVYNIQDNYVKIIELKVKEKIRVPELVLPDEIDGRPVYVLGNNSLKGLKKRTTVITLPSKLRKIESGALLSQSNVSLKGNYLPDSIAIIEEASLHPNIQFENLPKSIKYFGENDFIKDKSFQVNIKELKDLEYINSGYIDYNIDNFELEKVISPCISALNYNKFTQNEKNELLKKDIIIEENDLVYAIYDNKAYIIGNNYKTNKLIIPNTIKYKNDEIDVISICCNAFSDNQYIKIVILGEHIESINSKAFNNCENLRIIICNEKLEYIYKNALSNYLNYLYLNKSIKYIDKSNLKNIFIYQLNRSSIKNLIYCDGFLLPIKVQKDYDYDVTSNKITTSFKEMSEKEYHDLMKTVKCNVDRDCIIYDDEYVFLLENNQDGNKSAKLLFVLKDLEEGEDFEIPSELNYKDNKYIINKVASFSIISDKSIDNLIIPNTIESIEDYAINIKNSLNIEFQGKSKLKYIGTEGLVIGLECNKVVLPASIEVLGKSIFGYESEIEEIEFEKGSKLKYITDPFCNLNLYELKLPSEIEYIIDFSSVGHSIKNLLFEDGEMKLKNYYIYDDKNQNLDFCTKYKCGYYIGNKTNPYYALIKLKNSHTSLDIHKDTVLICNNALTDCVFSYFKCPDNLKYCWSDFNLIDGVKIEFNDKIEIFSKVTRQSHKNIRYISYDYIESSDRYSRNNLAYFALNNAFIYIYDFSNINSNKTLPYKILNITYDNFFNKLPSRKTKKGVYKGGIYCGSIENPYHLLVGYTGNETKINVHKDCVALLKDIGSQITCDEFIFEGNKVTFIGKNSIPYCQKSVTIPESVINFCVNEYLNEVISYKPLNEMLIVDFIDDYLRVYTSDWFYNTIINNKVLNDANVDRQIDFVMDKHKDNEEDSQKGNIAKLNFIDNNDNNYVINYENYIDFNNALCTYNLLVKLFDLKDVTPFNELSNYMKYKLVKANVQNNIDYETSVYYNFEIYESNDYDIYFNKIKDKIFVYFIYFKHNMNKFSFPSEINNCKNFKFVGLHNILSENQFRLFNTNVKIDKFIVGNDLFDYLINEIKEEINLKDFVDVLCLDDNFNNVNLLLDFYYKRKIDIEISDTNNYVKIENDSIYSADFKTLYHAKPINDNIIIKDGVEVLKKESCSDSINGKIVMPDSVKIIENDVFGDNLEFCDIVYSKNITHYGDNSLTFIKYQESNSRMVSKVREIFKNIVFNKATKYISPNAIWIDQDVINSIENSNSKVDEEYIIFDKDSNYKFYNECIYSKDYKEIYMYLGLNNTNGELKLHENNEVIQRNAFQYKTSNNLEKIIFSKKIKCIKENDFGYYTSLIFSENIVLDIELNQKLLERIKKYKSEYNLIINAEVYFDNFDDLDIGIYDGYNKKFIIPENTTKICKIYPICHEYNKPISINLSKNIEKFEFNAINNLSISKFTIEKGNMNYCIQNGVIYSYDKKIMYKVIKSKAEKFILPAETEVISNFAFEQCNYTEIELHDNVTSMGVNLFRNCMNLKVLKLPKKKDGILNFKISKCINLTEISIPNNTKKLTGMIEGCISLKNIEFPDEIIDLSNFYIINCDENIKIRLPKNIIAINKTLLVNNNVSKNIEYIYTNNYSAVMMNNNVSKVKYIVDNNNKYYSSIDYSLYNKDATELIDYSSSSNNIFKVPSTCLRFKNNNFLLNNEVKEIILNKEFIINREVERSIEQASKYIKIIKPDETIKEVTIVDYINDLYLENIMHGNISYKKIDDILDTNSIYDVKIGNDIITCKYIDQYNHNSNLLISYNGDELNFYTDVHKGVYPDIEHLALIVYVKKMNNQKLTLDYKELIKVISVDKFAQGQESRIERAYELVSKNKYTNIKFDNKMASASISGSNGLYDVSIFASQKKNILTGSCTCPDALKGKRCKHMIGLFILAKEFEKNNVKNQLSTFDKISINADEVDNAKKIETQKTKEEVEKQIIDKKESTEEAIQAEVERKADIAREIKEENAKSKDKLNEKEVITNKANTIKESEVQFKSENIKKEEVENQIIDKKKQTEEAIQAEVERKADIAREIKEIEKENINRQDAKTLLLLGLILSFVVVYFVSLKQKIYIEYEYCNWAGYCRDLETAVSAKKTLTSLKPYLLILSVALILSLSKPKNFLFLIIGVIDLAYLITFNVLSNNELSSFINNSEMRNVIISKTGGFTLVNFVLVISIIVAIVCFVKNKNRK